MSFLSKIGPKIRTPEYFFALLTIIFGGCLALLIPPFQTPDEAIHIYRAYEVAQFKHPSVQKGKDLGSFLPASIRETQLVVHGQVTNPAAPDQIAFNAANKSNIHDVRRALSVPLNKNKVAYYATGAAPAYIPVSYIPQAVIVWISSLFNAPVIVSLFAVRLANVSLWLVAGFIAIRLIPSKKWAVAGVFLLPVVVSQTVSEGLDAGAFTCFAVFAGLLVSRVQNTHLKLDARRLALLTVLGLLLVASKSVFAVFLPLIFLIKNSQITFKLPMCAKIFVAGFPILFYVLWNAILGRGSTMQADPNVTAQMHTLISAPWHFAQVLIHSFAITNTDSAILAQSIIGNFGYLDTPIPPLLISLGFMYLGVLLVSGDEPARLPPRARLYIGLAAGLFILSVFAAMFVYYTIPSNGYIRGVQGRYLVPSLMLVPLLGTFATVPRRRYRLFVQVGSTSLLLISVMTVLLRYYIHI